MQGYVTTIIITVCTNIGQQPWQGNDILHA